MCEQMEINVPTCFALNELSTLGTVLHPSNTDIGFLLAGEHFHTVNDFKPIVRIYLMNVVEDRFEVMQELESIKFDSTAQAERFVTQLPTLSALDLFLLVNNKQPLYV